MDAGWVPTEGSARSRRVRDTCALEDLELLYFAFDILHADGQVRLRAPSQIKDWLVGCGSAEAALLWH